MLKIDSKSTVPGFLQPVVPCTKTQQLVRPILDLSKLNNFLKTQSFKMGTPETIRTSLQAGEWVTSIEFKDAYFHIPINSQSRKYMYFHIQNKTYQFKALPFGLSTAPMEFTVIVKVKWIAMRKGIRIHQYLRAGTQTSFQFHRLPVRFERGQGQTHHRMLADLTNQNTGDPIQSTRSGLELHVPDRTTDCHREASASGQVTHETHTVASQKQLESAGNSGEKHPHPEIAPPHI